MDQAAGLRTRAVRASRPVPSAQAGTTLMVVGPPSCLAAVRALFKHWHHQGYRWLSDPDGWCMVPVSPDSAYLATLAAEQPRWALWVDRDAEAFRRGLATLTALRQHGGPRRLLAVHHPDVPRRGLIENLRQVAASRLEIDLLVFAK